MVNSYFQSSGESWRAKQALFLFRSPTRTATTQRNHLYASVCAYLKLERLKSQTKLIHFAMKLKVYCSASKAAYAELVKLNPQPLALRNIS